MNSNEQAERDKLILAEYEPDFAKIVLKELAIKFGERMLAGLSNISPESAMMRMMVDARDYKPPGQQP